MSPPQKRFVCGTRWSRRYPSNCAILLLFRPRQTNRNVTRHQIEAVKRFEKGKASATVRIEVEAWEGQGKEAT